MTTARLSLSTAELLSTEKLGRVCIAQKPLPPTNPDVNINDSTDVATSANDKTDVTVEQAYGKSSPQMKVHIVIDYTLF